MLLLLTSITLASKEAMKEPIRVALTKLAALQSRKCSELNGLYTDQAVILEPSSGTVQGKEKIVKNCQEFIQSLKHFQVSIQHVHLTDNQVLVSWTWFGVTINDCMFHIDGYTHFQLDPKNRIEKETDFYDVDELKRRLRCETKKATPTASSTAKKEDEKVIEIEVNQLEEFI